jgi:Tfp pilus assembly protein PilW
MSMSMNKHRSRQSGIRLNKYQAGITLMEALISLALSVVVTMSMVALMSNSMGSATRIIQMTQLTDELRNTMSMMSRDVRRANYNPYSIYCYANADCGVTDDTLKMNFIDDLDVVAYQGNNCLRYFLERTAPTGEPGTVGGGGFRLATAGGVGQIEMWTGAGAPPDDCSGNNWIAVTDPGFVNITEFTVNDDDGSFSETVTRKDGSTLLTMRTRQVRMQVEGELLIDPTITRRIEDTIRVRNDFIQSS